MKHKTGLHKKVSSIFGDVPQPDNPSVKNPSAGNNALDVDKTEGAALNLPNSVIEGHVAELPQQDHATITEPVHRTVAMSARILTEEQEYAASQKRKLLLVIGLCVALGLVLFVNFYKPGEKEIASSDKPSASVIPIKVSEIYWPEPEPWPKDIRDPMVYRADEAKLYVVESKIKGPVLRGIVNQKPPGRSSALIGTEILYEGEEIDGWTVKEVLKDTVRLENTEGEILELKMSPL